MPQFIALLRGVNVSGKNVLKMVELRDALKSAGLDDARTYIQSGNIVLKSKLSASTLETKIGDLLRTRFKVDTPVHIRSEKQWRGLLGRNPWPKLLEGKRLYVAFLDRKSKAKDHDVLTPLIKGSDRFFLSGNEIFLDLESAGRTKLTTNNIDKKTGAVSTARNLRTVQKLLALLDEP